MTMTAERHEALREQAIRWHVRIADGTADDWEAFVAWLGADPSHAQVYDEIEAADAIAGPALLEAEAPAPAVAVPPLPAAANDDQPRVSRRWWLGGSAAAAALALAVGIGPGLMRASDPYQVTTGPGESRVVTLASGDRIAMNGGSTLMLDRRNPRFAKLEQGEAMFTITHDRDAPFVVHVGEQRIEDVGTVFNVVRDGSGVRVAVAEGSVIYDPEGQAVTLAAGQALSDPAGNGASIRSDIDPEAVGTWREGRLSYAAAPLSLVATDLARATGQTVRLDPALSGRRFTGTIRIDADRDRLFGDLAQLLGVGAERTDGGWILTARERAKP